MCERSKPEGENWKFGFDYVRVNFAFRHTVEMLNRQFARPSGDEMRGQDWSCQHRNGI